MASRIDLPAEFYDRTSDRVLRAPLPQFLYARLVAAAAAQAELKRVGADSFTMLGRGPSTQGAAYPDLASNLDMLVADEIRADAVLVTDELAEGRVGSTIRINRPIFTGGGYTFAQRAFNASQKLSLVPIGLSDEQVTITIGRNSGPMSSSGTTPQPYLISRMDSQRSVHSLVERVGAALQYDRNALLDGQFAAHFDSSSLAYVYPGDSNDAITTDAGAWPTVPTGSSRPFDLETVLRMEQRLHDAKIPRFNNGRYMLFCTPKQMRQLASDPQYRGQSAYLQERNLLSTGANGTLVVNGAIEVYPCQTNTVDTSTVAGVSINHAVMFGPGMVGYAPTAEGVRIARANEDNYGEDNLVQWICYEGAAVLDGRFCASARSD
jgi:hypothetical protein